MHTRRLFILFTSFNRGSDSNVFFKELEIYHLYLMVLDQIGCKGPVQSRTTKSSRFCSSNPIWVKHYTSSSSSSSRVVEVEGSSSCNPTIARSLAGTYGTAPGREWRRRLASFLARLSLEIASSWRAW